MLPVHSNLSAHTRCVADRHRRYGRTPCCSSRSSAGRTSLVAETLEGMTKDVEQQELAERLARRGQAALTREERRKRQRSLDALDAPSFYALCQKDAKPLVRDAPQILQLNIGLYCNQACSHCHVESSPLRTEMMDRRTADRCLDLLRTDVASPNSSITTLDITGGAPELNSEFRYLMQESEALGPDGIFWYLVREARAMGLEVIDRCNLTVLLEPGQEDLPAFLASHQVRVVASLPCYGETNVDQQRGSGVFERSIQGLQLLNALGYGVEGSGLQLDLVYNPNGIFLSPPQATLQEAYKQELEQAYGITFNSLFCINNIPIKRYADYLIKRGELQNYMQMLVDSFNAAAADNVMCRSTINVGWDGRLFDCDFNQQLELGMRLPAGTGGHSSTVFDIDSLADLMGGPIACDNHCFGCTAGAGSSCQGALA